jgi:hypothetical protein
MFAHWGDARRGSYDWHGRKEDVAGKSDAEPQTLLEVTKMIGQ